MANRFNEQTFSGVPPAPVLRFPNNGKGAASANPKPTTLVAKKMTPRMEHFVLSVEDFRELSREERVELLEGELVNATCGSEVIGQVPLRLLLAASQTARARWLDPRSAKSLPRIGLTNVLFKEALELLIHWLKDTCAKHKCYWLSKQDSFAQDTNLIIAAQQLGMDIYIKHLINRHWAALKNDPLDLAKLLAIERAAPDESFTFFKCMVQRLAHMQLYSQIEDMEQYQRWMSHLPRLSAAIEPVYAVLVMDRERRQEERRERDEERARKKEEEKRFKAIYAEQREMARQERLEQARSQHERERKRKEEQALCDSAQRKLSSGRVSTIISEEVRFVAGARDRGI